MLLQQHPGIALRTGHTPPPGPLPALGLPVDRMTVMPLRSEAVSPAPGMSRVIRPARGSLDDDQALAMAGQQPVKHRLDRRRPRPPAAPAHQHPRLLKNQRHRTTPLRPASQTALTALDHGVGISPGRPGRHAEGAAHHGPPQTPADQRDSAGVAPAVTRMITLVAEQARLRGQLDSKFPADACPAVLGDFGQPEPPAHRTVVHCDHDGSGARTARAPGSSQIPAGTADDAGVEGDGGLPGRSVPRGRAGPWP